MAFYQRIWAQIDEDGVVQNRMVCDNYEDANYVTRCTYGEKALAVEINLWDVSEGCKYIDGTFYHEDGDTVGLVTYPIGTGQGGLRVTASSLRVRALPSTDSPQTGSLAKGSVIYPDTKTFDDRGVRWYRTPEGWVSGAYLTGWILKGGNGRWWYLLEGDTWYSGTIAVIDGAVYAFDDSGYMITDPVELTLDGSGALHLKYLLYIEQMFWYKVSMETREKYIIISGKVVPCKVIRKIRNRYLIDTGVERFTVEPGRLMNKQRPQDIPFWEKRPGIPGTWPH